MRTLALSFLALTSMILVSCETATSPSNPTEPSYAAIAMDTVDGVVATLYANSPFTAGYNTVWIGFEKDGQPLTTSSLNLNTMMDMGMMKHSSPVIQPNASPNSFNHYEGGIVFQMAGMADMWSVTVDMQDGALVETSSFTFGVDVAASSNVKVLAEGGHMGMQTIVTLVNNDWSVGMNDVDVLVYQTSNQMDFTPVTGLSMIVEPTMPSMGHGSHGNVNPSHTEGPWYNGQVNLTMSGEWMLTYEASTGGAPMPMFETDFMIMVP